MSILFQVLFLLLLTLTQGVRIFFSIDFEKSGREGEERRGERETETSIDIDWLPLKCG